MGFFSGETKEIAHFPSSIAAHDGVSVEYITMKGWKKPISSCKSFEDLPSEAQAYILKMEELLNIPGNFELTWDNFSEEGRGAGITLTIDTPYW